MKYFWIAAAAVIGIVVGRLPLSPGLSGAGQLVLAIIAFTATLWAAQPVSNAIASIVMMALLIAAKVPATLVFSGFSGGPFWVLLTVLFYGFAMKKTGLAERIAYYILSLFPGTYPGILAAFGVIGGILSLGIPSMTVRTAIMVPVAWTLVQSLELPFHSKGSALIILTTVEMAVVPGIGSLYGALSGPVVVAAFQAKHVALTWLDYFQVIGPPTILLCLLILIANQLVLRPEKALDASRSFARERLQKLGAFKRDELITAAVVLVSIVYWTTDRYHHLPSFLVGMVALAVFAVTGILSDQEMAAGVSWPLLLFVGGVFGLANIIQEYKIADWLAAFVVPLAGQLTASILVLCFVVALAMFVLRFIDPSSFIAISVLFLAIVDVTTAAQIPPLVLMAAVLLASVPFWLPYQNFWLAMGDGLTSSQAFTARQRLLLATTYAICVLAALAISTIYWKLAGIS